MDCVTKTTDVGLFYKECWMNCFTKNVGWTVIQRRLDELFYKEGWMNCFTKKVG